MSNDKNRFRIEKSDDMISVFGSAFDPATIELVFQDMINTERQLYDLNEMQVGTWIGLRSFYETITKNSKIVELENVPDHILRHLLLFDLHDKILKYLSINVIAVDGTLVHMENPDKQGLLKEHFIDHKPLLIGTYISMLIKGYSFPDTRKQLNMNPIQYAQFNHTTIELCSGLILAFHLEVLEFIKILKSKVEVFHNGLSKYCETYKDDLIKNIEIFEKESKSAFELQQKDLKILSTMAFNEISQVQNCKLTDGDIMKSFKKLEGLLPKLKSVCEGMEDNGIKVFNVIAGMNVIEGSQQYLSDISNKNLSGDELETFRDEFGIMDMDSEESWDLTMDYLAKEIKALVSKVKNLSIGLQSFDLGRQILEHRCQEIDLIKNIDALTQESVKKLHIKIFSKIVTDQEKLSYEFYFPMESEERGYKTQLATSELMFF